MPELILYFLRNIESYLHCCNDEMNDGGIAINNDHEREDEANNDFEDVVQGHHEIRTILSKLSSFRFVHALAHQFFTSVYLKLNEAIIPFSRNLHLIIEK